MSQDQREFLHIHCLFDHVSFGTLQKLAKKGIIPSKFAKVDPPLCIDCHLGKAHRLKRNKSNHIRSEHITMPGDLIHMDQAESSNPGRPMTHSGWNNKTKINCFTIFVDSVSKKLFVDFQSSTNAVQTLAGKHRMERSAKHDGVDIKQFRADNGIFKAAEVKLDIERQSQRISFCGVGAHNQNGIAERHIRTIVERARTILLHAMTRWPNAIKTELWTFAVNYTVDKWNATPREDLRFLSPNEVFSGQSEHDTTQDLTKTFHVWGCPVLVLKDQLQDGKAFPKWDARVRTGIFLGWSKHHASSVALVLNPNTDHISPQYHIVFDDKFETIHKTKQTENLNLWNVLSKQENRYHSIDNAIQVEFDTFEQPPKQLDQSTNLQGPTQIDEPGPSEQREPSTAPRDAETSSQKTHGSDEQFNRSKQSLNEEEPSLETSEPEGVRRILTERQPLPSTKYVKAARSNSIRSSHVFDPMRPSDSSGKRRSKRKRQRSQVVQSHIQNVHAYASQIHKDEKKLGEPMSFAAKIDRLLELSSNDDGTTNELEPHLFAANANPNILSHSEAKRADDYDKFQEAMQDELKRMIESKIFKEVPRSAVPMGQRVLRAVWSHRRKTTPAGVIYRHRSRVCADGSRQQYGIDYTDTYAPVISWTTVRILLILSVLLNLKTRQVDYVQAFPQASLPEDETIFMEIPDGYTPNGHPKTKVLQLLKNLYGLKQAAFHWNELLRSGLIKLGFTQSAIDPCLFLKKGIICAVYVDDTIFLADNDKIIDEHISSLKALDFDLTDEGDIEAFLGVQVERTLDENGNVTSIKMSQPGLTENITKALGLLSKESKCHDTPAVSPPLHAYKDVNVERTAKWNYRSVIGMLMYLSRNTRPDIEYAVHQCARYQLDPKPAHDNAVKRIGRYLLNTMDKGITFKPKLDLLNDLRVFVDADFAGEYAKERNDDPNVCKSRTGCIIMYAGCPITWFSRLQGEITLSTTESEYVALSTATRECLPMRELFVELGKYVKIGSITPNIQCTLFEDNSSCEQLAKSPKMNSRTKHIAIKYHHFRQAVVDGILHITRVPTEDQLADIFTKPVSRPILRHLRKEIMGWVSFNSWLRYRKIK